MKKTTGAIGAVVVGLAMLTLFTVSAPAAQRPGFETYVVRSGDTLGKISGRLFGTAKRWREILKENPQITNANLIFPGDILTVPVPERAASAGETDGNLAAGAGDGFMRTETAAFPAVTSDLQDGGAAPVPEDAAAAAGTGAEAGLDAAVAVPELPVEQMQPIAVVNPALYRTAGYISDNLPALAIIASPDDRILLGTDDTAIMNAPAPPGTRFTVVRADRRIFHPVTGAYLGWLMRILGAAEVTCSGERTATVTLRTMNDAASIGDYLVPLDPNDVLKQNALAGKAPPECIPAGSCDGVIVAFDEDRFAVSEYELAYIDRGTAAGVTPGRSFTIYRTIAPEGRVAVGELQVLRAGVHTSTALVTSSRREVQLGYFLRAR